MGEKRNGKTKCTEIKFNASSWPEWRILTDLNYLIPQHSHIRNMNEEWVIVLPAILHPSVPIDQLSIQTN